MNGSWLLDSNIVIDLFREDNATIEALKKFKSVYISVTVLGELFFGANASSRISERMVQVEAFSSKVSLLNCNKETARIYGKVKAQLKKNGTPIPENDIWIAAVAIQHDLVLVTNDNHFLNVEGLTIEMLRY